MKLIAVLYATREGHTCLIAERIADRFHAQGFDVLIRNVRDDDPPINLSQCSGAILAASVHAGKHEPEMVQFVREHRRELDRVPTGFLSVTLSQAGVERSYATPVEHAGFTADVRKMLNDFFEETQWRPDVVEPVAGALVYRKYNFLVRWMMKRIAQKAGGSTDTSRNHDYTNWEALDRFANSFAQRITEHSCAPSR
jgi:menaquinone-dependent protoporphyrinogen oxidase